MAETMGGNGGAAKYECNACGNTEEFVRYRDPEIRREKVDASGRLLEDLGWESYGEPDPEIRCGRGDCDAVLVEGG